MKINVYNYINNRIDLMKKYSYLNDIYCNKYGPSQIKSKNNLE